MLNSEGHLNIISKDTPLKQVTSSVCDAEYTYNHLSFVPISTYFMDGNNIRLVINKFDTISIHDDVTISTDKLKKL